MNDDWRLRADLHEDGHAHSLAQGLEARELEHDLETSVDDRVIVSRDGPEVFFYTGSREQAERVRKLVASLAAERGWNVESDLKHWHPTAERWEDPDDPLPATEAERAAEHEELIQSEREELRSEGFPEWEVRVQCPSHQEAQALAERLRAQGIPSVQRSRYLLVGAPDEDSAGELAKRILEFAPPGATADVEGTAVAVQAALPLNPFAVLGGMGG
jgi:hypothetical protein